MHERFAGKYQEADPRDTPAKRQGESVADQEEQGGGRHPEQSQEQIREKGVPVASPESASGAAEQTAAEQPSGISEQSQVPFLRQGQSDARPLGAPTPLPEVFVSQSRGRREERGNLFQAGLFDGILHLVLLKAAHRSL